MPISIKPLAALYCLRASIVEKTKSKVVLVEQIGGDKEQVSEFKFDESKSQIENQQQAAEIFWTQHISRRRNINFYLQLRDSSILFIG